MKRILLATGVMVGCCVLAIFGYFITIRAKVSWYDKRFQQIELGQTEAELVRSLGKPFESLPRDEHNSPDIERFYIYQVERLGAPVKWEIGLNSQGKVVSMHRDENGC